MSLNYSKNFIWLEIVIKNLDPQSLGGVGTLFAL